MFVPTHVAMWADAAPRCLHLRTLPPTFPYGVAQRRSLIGIGLVDGLPDGGMAGRRP